MRGREKKRASESKIEPERTTTPFVWLSRQCTKFHVIEVCPLPSLAVHIWGYRVRAGAGQVCAICTEGHIAIGTLLRRVGIVQPRRKDVFKAKPRHPGNGRDQSQE
jgi:hypothetical protein